MKSLSVKTLLAVCMLAANLLAAASEQGFFAGTPEERQIPIEHVYAPSGFDNNDNVEIVITGHLPNLCHKSPSAKVKVNGRTVEVEVTSLYYSESNPFCPEMVVPFVQTVQIGLLEEGEYRILVNKGGNLEASAKIHIGLARTENADDHNYAYVEYIEKSPKSDVVALKGYHVSDCFVMDRIEYFHNERDTYSILPILKQVSNFCPKKFTPFSYTFQVPDELEAARVLLHVRTLEGNSVNAIFTRGE